MVVAVAADVEEEGEEEGDGKMGMSLRGLEVSRRTLPSS